MWGNLMSAVFMIKVENITKNFGRLTAVNNVSFAVKEGEILGFLGPNGAGKSTTMRMITGFFPQQVGISLLLDVMFKTVHKK